MPTIALCTLLAVGRCFQAETAANTKPAAKRMLPPLLLLLLALAGQGAGPPPSFRTRSGSVCRGPPVISSGGIAGLNALVENVAAAWQWLDRSHTSGFVGNFNQTNLIPLNWTYLNGVPLPQDAHHRPQQSHSFEPNENHKTAPILLDLARFPGGAIMHPTATMPYNQLAAVILRTYTAILDPASPLFANFLTDWKDQAILGYPTPATNQNTNPGYSFTRNGREKYQADMVAADGQLYGLFSAAAHELQTGVCPERCVSDPARHVAADLAGLGAPLRWSATGFVDEQLFQAMNRFLRGDWASVKRMLDGAIDRNNGNAWDSVGFGKNRKPGYRGEFLGMYLSVSRIAAPVLRQKGACFAQSELRRYDCTLQNHHRESICRD
jgi:hypothetical protein